MKRQRHNKIFAVPAVSPCLNKLLSFGNVVLSDGVGIGEINEFVEGVNKQGYDGENILFAVIQKVIPASGASFVK